MQRSLGKVLKLARTNANLSLRDVERRTGGKISNGYLSLLETGKVDNPSPHHLYELSLFYKLDYLELMKLSGYYVPRAGDVSSQGLALSSAEDLTTEERKQVDEYIDFLRSRRGGS